MPVLTDAAVRRYKPSRDRREIPDDKSGGRLIIQPSGAKSWAKRLRRPNGKPAKITLGPFDHSGRELQGTPVIGQPLTVAAMRMLDAEINRQRAMGIDVVAELAAVKHRQRAAAEERGANGFAAALREFFVDHNTKWHERPRQWADDARLLGLRWPPDCDPAITEPELIKGSLAETWAGRDVRALDSHDIHVAVDEARRFGIPGLARRNGGVSESRGRKVHSALSAMFSWLLRQRRIASNPLFGVWRPSAPPARDRVLSDREVAWLWRASDRLASQFGAAVKVLLLTGARLAEVSGMRRDELSEDGESWVIPPERAKNHRRHVVALSTLAREIIASVPRVEGEAGYVFTTTSRSPISGWSKAKAALDAAMLQVAREEAAAAGRDPSKVALAPFRLHDCRRTAASTMLRLGVRLETIERVLNHLSGSFGGIVQTYQVDMLVDEQRAALEALGEHIRRLTSGGTATVVHLRRGKKGA